MVGRGAFSPGNPTTAFLLRIGWEKAVTAALFLEVRIRATATVLASSICSRLKDRWNYLDCEDGKKSMHWVANSFEKRVPAKETSTTIDRGLALLATLTASRYSVFPLY